MKATGSTIALLVFAGQAHATAHVLTLSGTVADGSYSSQTIGNTTYDQWFLNLSGITPFVLEQGDTVDVTLTLDQSFTIPASANLTVVNFFLFGSAFSANGTGTTAISETFIDAGIPTTNPNCGDTTTSSQIAAGCVYPGGTPITFDTFLTSFTVDTLDAPTQIEAAGLQYTLFSTAAVPEPASWALMIAGFALAGGAMRRRPLARIVYARG